MAQAGAITSYKWNENGDVTQVNTRQDGDGTIAYVHASPQATHMEDLLGIFKGKGWTQCWDEHQDHRVLRVTGMNNADELITLLQHGGYTQGQAERTTSQHGATSLLHDKQGLSGMLYLFGDYLFYKSGRKHGQNLDQMGMAGAFAAGDLAFMIFGRHNEDREANLILKGLMKDLQKNNIDIPKDSALQAEMEDKSSNTLGDIIYKYIDPFKIAMEVLGGALLFRAGRAKPDAAHPDRVPNKRKQASGLTIIAGWGTTLALQTLERLHVITPPKLDSDEYRNAGALKKAWIKVQNSPHMVAGASGLTHNGLVTWGALEERNDFLKGTLDENGARRGTPHWKWDAMAVWLGMVPANIAYATSQTQTKLEDNYAMRDVYALTGQMLSMMPQAQREDALATTSAYFASRREVKETQEQITQYLRSKMDIYAAETPWRGQKDSSQPTTGTTVTPERSWRTQPSLNHQDKIMTSRESSTAQADGPIR